MTLPMRLRQKIQKMLHEGLRQRAEENQSQREMKIKDILSKVKCKCGNTDPTAFIMYFVMDTKTRITKTYISCQKCSTVYEYETQSKEVRVKDYTLTDQPQEAG